VWDPPTVAQNLDLLLEAGDVDGLGREQRCESGEQRSGFHWGHNITPWGGHSWPQPAFSRLTASTAVNFYQ
jgi:hypothetical protein